MSRIGKKPIPLPAGVKYTVSENGNTVLVEGPKGKVSAMLPGGITLVQKDGTLVAERQNDKQAAFHGLARALVFNAVTGVTTGWTKDIDIVGIGYRAEMKGKNMVVFTLGFSHPIEFPLPTGISRRDRPQADPPHHLRHRPAEGWPGRRRHAFAPQARSVQEQGRPLHRREAEEEGRQDRSEVIQRL